MNFIQTIIRVAAVIAALAPRESAGQSQRKIELNDVFRIRTVSDPQISPDGAWVAYTVSAVDTAEDKANSDIWMVSWDGRRQVRLTSSKANEHAPRWSPDGRYLGFLSERDDAREVEQLWLLDRTGGEAERITDLPGGVSDYAWAPGGKRVALIVSDPDPDSTASSPDSSDQTTPKPIVITRYQFKEDETGYLDRRRSHLYLFELAGRKATLLTPGEFNELWPSWSPDGRAIAFVSKRRPDFDRTNNWDLYVVEASARAAPRQLTTFEGPDMDPQWGGRAPAWSPDGKHVAYVQGGPLKLIYYAGQKLAVVPAAGGPARVITPTLDRNALSPVWTADGSSLRFLLEEDRVTHVASVPAAGGPVQRLTQGRSMVSDLAAGPDGKMVVLSSTPQVPAEIFAVEAAGLRRLSHQNDSWLRGVRLASLEEISFKSRDGTPINGFMMRPLDYRFGTRVPAVLKIHGGPVYQFSNEFDLEWQLLAAEGFAVVAANPRGSSGRGEKFSTAIYADWGNKDTEDVLAAVDHAVSAGVADPDRLGVGGWSYGGILTNQVIARDRRFKAAISGAGLSNAFTGYGTDQYVREYEAELGTPWENADVYRRVSYPFFNAHKIVTPTLFLCGDKDLNVPLINSEQMFQALKSLGRETELVIYPGESHEIKIPSYRRDRQERYLAWYKRHLLKQGTPEARSTSANTSQIHADVSVEVENHNSSDITVYLVTSGLPQRLGMVTAMSTASFAFRAQRLNTAGSIRLRALPVAGTAHTSEPILVQPGQTISWTLQTDLDTSSWTVY
ncbi:MAG TPA: S9 family peptidase [Gemmatimonadales bacterium]|nr:S9 family peptidase [Gemmatimonadales bacterium]